MKYVIKIESPQASELIQRVLLAQDWRWQGEHTVVQQTHRPFLCLDFYDRLITWSEHLTQDNEITAKQLISHLLLGEELPSRVCRLGDYDAVLIHDEKGDPAMKLGCQTITLEQIRNAWELLSGEKTVQNIWPENSWLAMDEDGDWYIFHKKPTKREADWVADPNDGRVQASLSLTNLPKCDNWEESLTRLG